MAPLPDVALAAAQDACRSRTAAVGPVERTRRNLTSAAGTAAPLWPTVDLHMHQHTARSTLTVCFWRAVFGKGSSMSVTHFWSIVGCEPDHRVVVVVQALECSDHVPDALIELVETRVEIELC